MAKRLMDEVVFLPGFRHADFATTRGMIYVGAMKAGHSDFAAMAAATGAARSTAAPVLSIAQVAVGMTGAAPAEILAA